MTQLIQTLEGLSLIICGIMIFLSLRRKGKNRTLQMLAWFFIGGGIFRLSMFLSGLFTDNNAWPIGTLVISNACLYFGIAVYISMQIELLRGHGAGKKSFIISSTLAALLSLFHLAVWVLPNIGPSMFSFLDPWVGGQLTVMLIAMAVSFLVMVILFVMFVVHAKTHNEPLTMNSGIQAGLGLMLISWMLQKIVQVDIGSTMAAVLSALPFISIVVVIAAIFLGTTSSMSPGAVYDSVTKRPIPLAIVRIFRMSDQKLLESRVTDESGHYGMLVGPGHYTIDATCQTHQFPAQENIGYRGQTIHQRRTGLVGYDIYMDPTG